MVRMKNQQGFSITQVLIAAGLMSMLALFMARQMKLGLRMNKTSESNFESTFLWNNLQNFMAIKENCEANLAGLDLGVSSNLILTQLVNQNSAVVYQTGNVYGNGAVRITSMTLEPVSGSDQVDFTIALHKEGNTLGAVDIERQLSLKINYQTTSNGQPTSIVDSCENDFNLAVIQQVNQAIDEAVNQAVQNACQGPGVMLVSSSNPPLCRIKGFSQSSQIACPQGLVVSSVQEDPSSGNYSVDCVSPFPAMDCPMGLKFVAGQIQCLQATDIIDSTAVTINANDICQIVAAPPVVSNPTGTPVDSGTSSQVMAQGAHMKLKLFCHPPPAAAGGGGCTPNCSDAHSYCAGVTYPSFDGCGTCVGTKIPQHAFWTNWVPSSPGPDDCNANCEVIQTAELALGNECGRQYPNDRNERVASFACSPGDGDCLPSGI